MSYHVSQVQNIDSNIWKNFIPLPLGNLIKCRIWMYGKNQLLTSLRVWPCELNKSMADCLSPMPQKLTLINEKKKLFMTLKLGLISSKPRTKIFPIYLILLDHTDQN